MPTHFLFFVSLLWGPLRPSSVDDTTKEKKEVSAGRVLQSGNRTH